MYLNGYSEPKQHIFNLQKFLCGGLYVFNKINGNNTNNTTNEIYLIIGSKYDVDNAV